jgi:hypothetical protein
LEAEPEEGKPAEVAAVLDALADAQKKAREAKKQAVQGLEISEEAERKVSEMMAAAGPGADKETMSNIEKAMEEAERAKAQADKASRRAAKANAKAEDAEKEAQALGVKPSQDRDDESSNSTST